MTEIRHYMRLVELLTAGGAKLPPPKTPRGGSPWGDDDPNDFDEYTIFWVRGPLLVRCKLGTPEQDFAQRRDALQNYDVWKDPELASLGEFDPDNPGIDEKIFMTALKHNFAMIHIEWHEMTKATGIPKPFDIFHNATATSGYNISVTAKDEPIAQKSCKLLVNKYGDLPAKIMLRIFMNGDQQERLVTGPQVRAFLSQK